MPPKLAARVRLLEAGDTNKDDPNDALSVAVAALRSKSRREVTAEDYAAVLKVWAKRHRDLSRACNQVACRLHAVLCGLVPGGFSKEITAGQAARVLEQITPSGAIAQGRYELASQFLDDLRNLDAQLLLTKKKLAAAVRASRTTVTEIFGVAPVIAGTVIGDIASISRFATRDHFAAHNGTAPAGVSSGGRITYRLSLRGNRRINHAIHMAAITQIRNRHSDGRAYYDRKVAEGDLKGSAPVPQAADQQRHLRPPPGRRPPGRRDRCEGPGRAIGERLCLQRGRLTPRTPALRTSHSRARNQPTARHPAQACPVTESDFKEDPAKPLTAKRTRSARVSTYDRDQSGLARLGVLRP